MMEFKPELTFGCEEVALVKRDYQRAKCIFEFGSGGSTILAAELGGKSVLSIETDAAWASNMSALLKRNHPEQDVRVIHSNIGPTGEWGVPTDHRRLRYWQYLRYSHAPWWRRDISAPDLVLIDGRFRLACFMAVLTQARHPVRILFDDYTRSKTYQRAEAYCKPTARVGRMAVFDVQPRSVSRFKLLRDVKSLVDYH